MLRLGSASHRVPWWAGRAGLLALLVTVGYWLSLGSLWSDLGGQTPLAFIGLAPILAFGLLLAGLRRREPLPFPGRVDLVVGLLLIALAGAIVLTGPSLASIYFWTARLDIASLPLFAGGALILLFGWRVLFVARGAMALLLLTWPLPYLVLLENSSDLLTDITTGALRLVVSIVPIATVSLGDSATFTVAHSDPFQVQVATACAGLNSTVAFTLVGSAFVLVLRGPWLGKVAWFAAGLVLVFALNVLRVILLVAAGAAYGQSVALDFFHPVAGMVALAGGLMLMLIALPSFRLALPDLRPQAPAASPLPEVPAAPPTRRAMTARVALLGVVAVLFAAVNSTFAAYESGPGLTSVVAQPVSGEIATLGGWRVVNQHDIDIGKPYYGSDSTWTRYRLRPETGTPDELQYTIWADSVTTSNRQALQDFGVDKCYRFHGYSIDAAEPVQLGSGIVGSALAVTKTNNSEWVVLWWEWPVDQAGEVVHERITLLASTTVRPEPPPASTGSQPLILFQPGTPIPEDLRPLTLDMASIASQIVRQQTADVASR